METITADLTANRISTWGEAVAGLLPVAGLSLAITLEGTDQSGFTGVLSYMAILLLVALPAIGIPLALERDLPRWSSPYLGLIVPGVLIVPNIFMEPLFASTLGMLFLRGATVLLLAFAIFRISALLLRKPARAEPHADHDWTQIIFGAQVLIPLVVMVTFDETAMWFKTGWELACGLILVAGALVYLRTRSRWLGAVALLASAVLAVWLSNTAASMYWSALSGQ